MKKSIKASLLTILATLVIIFIPYIIEDYLNLGDTKDAPCTIIWVFGMLELSLLSIFIIGIRAMYCVIKNELN